MRVAMPLQPVKPEAAAHRQDQHRGPEGGIPGQQVHKKRQRQDGEEDSQNEAQHDIPPEVIGRTGSKGLEPLVGSGRKTRRPEACPSRARAGSSR